MGDLNRIMILGQPGSGKSTLARKLGDITGLPVVHIDREVHWLPGWVERPKADKARIIDEIHARDQWIFEGGDSSSWPERLARADMLIWLDPPFLIRCWRVFVRTLRYHGQSRPDLPDNCPERFDWEFAMWIWNTRHSAREKMRDLYDSAPEAKAKYRFENLREVKQFLAELQHRI